MREIAAASDYDFVAVEPRRPSRPSSQRGKSAKKKSRSAPPWLAALWRYRTPAIGVSALFFLLGAIVVNAMFLQRQKHPAPLFGATFQVEPPQPAAQAAPRTGGIEALLADKLSPAPLAPVGPAPASALAPPPVAAPVHIAAVAPAARVEAPAPVKKNRDAIGALISGAPAATSPAAPSRTVMAAQRALQKLGMVVNPDGRMDATTRSALEIFQHDNHLPANGELTPKTRMMLSAFSGVAVE